MVEKKKVYDFFGNESPEEINLSDEFLGNKIKVKKISIVVDDKSIYKFSCDYDQQGSTVEGFTMGSKNLPPETS